MIRADSRLDWIKAHVPILDVARKLGIDASRNPTRCWRAAQHRNRDRKPSLGFEVARNRYKCFVCDSRSGSNVDLVMARQNVSLSQALAWFSANFAVPQPTRSITALAEPGRATQAGVVACGVWSRLSDAERAILGVLFALRERGEAVLRVSYSRIVQLAGPRSRKTVSACIKRFEAIGLLRVERANRRMSAYRFPERLDPEKLSAGGALPSRHQKLVSPEETSLRESPSSEAAFSAVPNASSPITKPTPKLVSPAPHIKASVSPEETSFGNYTERERQVLRLAQRGFLLFPCKLRSKEPAVGNWQALATADAAKLATWFTEYRECNWGARTGPGSRMFVLDVDGEKGHAWLRSLAGQDAFAVAATLGVRTARGVHLYFRWPNFTVHNSAGKVAPGLDVRGRGGYVLVPPSVHPDGAAYKWLADDETRAIALPPAWLLEAIGNDEAAPAPRCYIHGEEAIWWDRGGELVCGRCHPPVERVPTDHAERDVEL